MCRRWWWWRDHSSSRSPLHTVRKELKDRVILRLENVNAAEQEAAADIVK